jgi:hypothetical protein
MGGPDRTVGEDSAVGNLWCQGKRLQGIVVGLQDASIGWEGHDVARTDRNLNDSWILGGAVRQKEREVELC